MWNISIFNFSLAFSLWLATIHHHPEAASRLTRNVKPQKGNGSYEISSIDFVGGRINAHNHVRTFSVEAMHEKLPDGSGVGVRFNVETVRPAEEEHLHKPEVSWKEIQENMKRDAASFYDDDELFPIRRAHNIRLEAVSDVPNSNTKTTVFSGGSGYLAASLTAFAQHLPLAISPDHIWTLLSYAFAKHVDIHAEELRKNFVQHEGKKRLLVSADHLVMGGGNLTLSSPANVWEDTIFPEFSSQIKGFIGEKLHSVIAPDFSTTSNTARAAHEIALMSATKNYFSFGMGTLCGIPRITLLGLEEDWVSLRAFAEDLGKLMAPEIAKQWMPYLIPVLDEFVNSYRGDVNHGFWQSMVKLRNHGDGSGSTDFISGWLQIFFPYLSTGQFNNKLRHWNELDIIGPDSGDFPTTISSAPVDWDYFGNSHNLHFHAGITGFTQDANDGTLAPLIGWYVTHEPPQDPDVRLAAVKKEIEDLLKGHAEEARAEALDTNAPWYARVHTLHLEQLSLEGPARRIVLQREEKELERKIDLGELEEDEGYEELDAVERKRGKTEEQLREQDKVEVSTDAMIKDAVRKNMEKTEEQLREQDKVDVSTDGKTCS